MSESQNDAQAAPLRQMQLKRTFSQSTKSQEERVKQAVVAEAFSRGMWGALYGTVAGSLGMLAAHRVNFMGVRRFSVSVKTGLIVTSAVTPFWLRGELTLVEGRDHPERFVSDAQHKEHASKPKGLAPWQHALNFVYDNPFQTWGAIVIPSYAAIFAYESSNPATAQMVLSQRILHTRVIGQFTAISVLLAVGITQDTMRKAGGRFEEADDEDEAHGTASSADGESSEDAVISSFSRGGQREGGMNWNLLVPLLYAPLFPLLRIGLRNRVTKRQLDLITGGTIAVALAHAGVIMAGDSTIYG